MDPDTEILHKSSYKILISGPHIEILHKWSDRILIEVVEYGWKGSWNRDLVLKDATNGPKGILNREIQVIQKESEAEILHKWCYKILIQVVRKDPQRSLNRSCTSAPTGSR